MSWKPSISNDSVRRSHCHQNQVSLLYCKALYGFVVHSQYPSEEDVNSFLVRRLTSSQNPVCDLSGLTTGNHRTHGKKSALPHQTWGATKVLKSQTGVMVRMQVRSHWPTSTFASTFLTRAPLWWGRVAPPTEAFPSHLQEACLEIPLVNLTQYSAFPTCTFFLASRS